MFRISKKTEYGILALQYIVEAQDRVATVREIAEKHEISPALLAKILQQLARKKIIQSVQGPRGGYRLNHHAATITLKDIFEAIEGPIHLTECDSDEKRCSRHDICTLKESFDPIHRQLSGFFENISLADLVTTKNV